MGKQIVYCEVCGDRILESDIAAGKAIVVARRDYCAKCRDKAPKNIAPSEAIIPAAPGSRAVDSTRRLAAHVRPGGSSHHGAGRPPASSQSSVTLVAGVVIGGIAVLLAVFAMMPGSSSDPVVTRTFSPTPRPTPTDRSAEEASAAFNRIREFVQDHPDEAETIVARIEAERDKLQKTSYWDSVEGYLKQANLRLDRKSREKKLAESLARIIEIENGDPRYEQRPKVLELFTEVTSMALALDDAAKTKVDEAEKAYTRRFNDAGNTASLTLMAKAGRFLRENKFDDALAALDEFPPSFNDTPAVENIRTSRAQVEEKKRAAEQQQSQALPWIAEHWRVFKAVQADSSEATWAESLPVIEKTLANLKDYELVSRVSPPQRLQLRNSSYYLMAIYAAQFKQDYNKSFGYLNDALHLGAPKEALDFIEKQPFLANLRKDPRYKAFMEKYAKKYGDPNRRWIGVQGYPLFKEEYERTSLAADEGGFFVAGVIPDSIGAKIGLQGADVIISFAGEKLSRSDPFGSLDVIVEKVKSGVDYPLVIFRSNNGKDRVTLTVRWP